MVQADNNFIMSLLTCPTLLPNNFLQLRRSEEKRCKRQKIVFEKIKSKLKWL